MSELEHVQDNLSVLSGKFHRLIEKLLEKGMLSQIEYIQFIEGDC